MLLILLFVLDEMLYVDGSFHCAKMDKQPITSMRRCNDACIKKKHCKAGKCKMVRKKFKRCACYGCHH
ncbi:hypothetical protein Y032_0133g1766 [Ancylostoma ceylanicum]|nr:hypothetical protein Y032_0133g1766 [Ancylostoma ceylanicum]